MEEERDKAGTRPAVLLGEEVEAHTTAWERENW